MGSSAMAVKSTHVAAPVSGVRGNGVLRGVGDFFAAIRLMMAADRLEGMEKARFLKNRG